MFSENYDYAERPAALILGRRGFLKVTGLCVAAVAVCGYAIGDLVARRGVIIKARHIRICVVNGANQGLEEVLHRVRLDKNRYHFIEVMNCPGGCVNGGGQPVQPVGTAWLNPTLPLPLRA